MSRPVSHASRENPEDLGSSLEDIVDSHILGLGYGLLPRGQSCLRGYARPLDEPRQSPPGNLRRPAKETEHEAAVQPYRCLTCEIPAVTAPWVVAAPPDKARFDRVPMDIADELQKRRICIDQPCTVAAFEQMAGAVHSGIDRPRIAGCEVVDNRR